jgi:hypothetical protein
LFRRVVFFLFPFVLIAVRERVRRTAKLPFFAVRPIPAARQSLLDVVSSSAPSVTQPCRLLLLFAVRRM